MCLGTRKDEAYTAQLIPQLAEAIGKAHAALVPAKAAGPGRRARLHELPPLDPAP